MGVNRQLDIPDVTLREYVDIRVNAIHERVDRGDNNLREHIIQQGESLALALQSSRREAALVQDTNDKQLNRIEAYTLKRVEEGDVRLREHIMQQFSQISSALDAARRESGFAADASTKSIEKAELATEKRFEAVNEFRGQLADQAARFQLRELSDQQTTAMEIRLRTIEERLSNLAGQEQAQRRATDRQSLGIGQIIGFLGLAITLLGIIAAVLVGSFT